MAKSFVVSGVLALAVAGCAVDAPELGSTAGMSFEEFKSRVSREPGTGAYVVDWDIVVYGDDALLELYYRFQQGALAIYTQGGQDVKWNDTQKKQLTYCISNNFGVRKQAVIDAMRFASDEGWEKFADVDFIYVPEQDANCNAQNPNVLFDVSPINNAPYIARAFFPGDPRQYRNVMIDSSGFSLQGSITLANVVAHELGHVLGFRHEHTRPEAGAADCYEDNQFRPLTTYDSASVMHYPQCNGTSTTLAFTQRDQQGVASVYGPPVVNVAPMTQVMSPTNGATVAPTFEVQAQVVDTDLSKVELLIDGALYQTLTAAPFNFVVQNLSIGAHSLEIRGTDSKGLTGTQTVLVIVASGGSGSGGDGGGTGTGPGSVDDFGDDVITGGCQSSQGQSGIVVGLGLGLAALARRRRR
jgi:hypothetical protein